jgi:hypothetical protein
MKALKVLLLLNLFLQVVHAKPLSEKVKEEESQSTEIADDELIDGFMKRANIVSFTFSNTEPIKDSNHGISGRTVGFGQLLDCFITPVDRIDEYSKVIPKPETKWRSSGKFRRKQSEGVSTWFSTILENSKDPSQKLKLNCLTMKNGYPKNGMKLILASPTDEAGLSKLQIENQKCIGLGGVSDFYNNEFTCDFQKTNITYKKIKEAFKQKGINIKFYDPTMPRSKREVQKTPIQENPSLDTIELSEYPGDLGVS